MLEQANSLNDPLQPMPRKNESIEKEPCMDIALLGGSSCETPKLNRFDDNKPLWKYVLKLEKIGGGGNYHLKCNFCHTLFKGSYTRVRAHLMKVPGKGVGCCKKVTCEDLAEMQKEIDEAELRIQNAQPKNTSLAPQCLPLDGMNYTQGDIYESKKRRTSESDSGSATEKVSDTKFRDQLHQEIARMFYSAGLPFQLAQNPYFISSFSFAANHSILGYLPPTYKMLRTTLLRRERENIDRLLQPLKSMWREKGVSIVSDGWNDSQRRPLINFMAVSGGRCMFLKAIDCSGELKDTNATANVMKEVINEIGPQNVVQVITDNAPNCKVAGKLIEAQFPSILWTPCVVHTLNLALESIFAAKNAENIEVKYEECGWINDIVSDVMVVKHFITNHSMRLDMYDEFMSLKLLSVAETRFASTFVILKRLKQTKHGLQAMVISDKWSCFKQDDIRKASFVRRKVLDDVWWDSIGYILSFTAPIYDMLRALDTDKPCLHLVYDMWHLTTVKVKRAIYRHEGKRLEEDSAFCSVVLQILADLRNENSTPLHCLAHSLNPKYYSDEWLREDPGRVPPHRDEEVSRERNKCLKRYFEVPMERTMVMVEYAKFSTKVDSFAESDSIRHRWSIDPYEWWVVHGAYAPKLQTLALKLLMQPSSSSCCEKNWSTYSFVRSVRKSKLIPQRAEDLVFIHNNLRLLSRNTPLYVQGETLMWDIAGDNFDSLDDIGVLEVANLSLDEPQLETVLFTDEGLDEDQGDEDVEAGSC